MTTVVLCCARFLIRLNWSHCCKGWLDFLFVYNVNASFVLKELSFPKLKHLIKLEVEKGRAGGEERPHSPRLSALWVYGKTEHVTTCEMDFGHEVGNSIHASKSSLSSHRLPQNISVQSTLYLKVSERSGLHFKKLYFTNIKHNSYSSSLLLR